MRKYLLIVMAFATAILMTIQAHPRVGERFVPGKVDASLMQPTAATSTLSALGGQPKYSTRWWDVPLSAPTSVSALNGYYIQDTYAQNPTTLSGMFEVQIEAGQTANQIIIKNFYGCSGAITATIDPTQGTITIPGGALCGTFPDGGNNMNLYLADFDKALYYPDDIVAKVSSQGIITFPQMLIIVEGLGQIRCYNDKWYQLNSTATDYSLWPDESRNIKEVNTYGVHYSRTNTGSVLIKNFYGHGFPVTATLDSTGHMSIARSTICQVQSGTTVKNLSNYNVTKIDTTKTPPVPTMNTSSPAATFATRDITTGSYCVANGTSTTSTSTIRWDLIEKTVITVPENQAFTGYSAKLNLNGSGTKDDPYIIANVNDLQALALTSNYNAGLRKNRKVFTGMYFKQTADIDLKDVENWDPISMTDDYAFAGNYDGQGHTISNLTYEANRPSASYRTGLFGSVAVGAYIHDLKLNNFTLSSNRSYLGALAGQFNGTAENISVSNLKIRSLTTTYVGGLVGATVGGRIINCSTTGEITADNFLGGISGNNNGAKILNCYSEVNITRSATTTNNAYMGGITASFTRDSTLIQDCGYTGTIQGNKNEKIGGIVGYAQAGRVVRCWAGGNIMVSNSSYADETHLGGIAGHAYGGRISDSHFTGIIQCYMSENIGGIVGKIENGDKSSSQKTTVTPEIKNSGFTGTIFCSGAQRGNEIYGKAILENIIENNWFDGQASYNYGKEGKTTAELTSGTLPAGLNAADWSVAAGKYPLLKAFASKEKAKLDAVPFFLADGETRLGVKSAFTLGNETGITWAFLHNLRYTKTGNGLTIDGNNVTVTATTMTSDTLVAYSSNGELFRMYVIKTTPKEFDGEGTAQSPYLIKSKADLDKIFHAVDNELYDYTGVYFKFANDIDMSGTPDTFRGYSNTAPEYGFNGTIDGDGHAIKNYRVTKPSSQNVTGAFLIYTGPNTVIKNIVIDSSCSIEGGSSTGFIAANYGHLEGIINHANITGYYRYTGAIAGQSYQGSSITRCYNDGNITGGDIVTGGIVGITAADVNIDNCQNAGIISSRVIGDFNQEEDNCMNVGGIVGSNSGNVTNCLNQGRIEGYRFLGGIIGSIDRINVTITGNLNTGIIYDGIRKGAAGAITGEEPTNANEISSNVWDKQFSYIAAVANNNMEGCTGLTTAELTSGQAVSGLSTDLWQYSAGKYPVLKAFADMPASQFYASTYVTFANQPHLESRADKRSDATITMPQGSTATLKSATIFSINGTTLSHKIVKTVEVDTLTMTSADNSYKAVVPMFATPRLLENGNGTANDPWLISNADDWLALANYSNTYSKSFEGEYFKVTADIDFKDKEFKPICGNGDVYFQGIMDGNNKRFLNIVLIDADNKYKGVFGLVGTNSIIHDVIIDESCSFTGSQYVGALAGSVSGEAYGIINYASTSTTNMGYCGGLFGIIRTGGIVHDCVNYGTVSSANTGGGGIAGTGEKGINIYNNVNRGSVTAKGSAGGIFGSIKSSLRDCTNYGEITSTTTNAGGIAGYYWSTDTIDDKVINCVNHGNITTTTSGAGGILGMVQTGAAVSNATNHGTVYAGTNCAGGIVGTTMSTTAYLRIDGAENHGRVSTKTNCAGGILGKSHNTTKTTRNYLNNAYNYATVQAGSYRAGGIAGEVGSYVAIRNCYNYADTVMSTTYQAGGIAGMTYGLIENCYNQADVTAGTYEVGGIAGNASTSTTYGVTFRNVANVGNVESLGTTDTNGSKVGGIAGYGLVRIENAVNLGDVKGRKSVAGIVGLPYKGSSASSLGTQVYNSFNAGRIECTVSANANTCGNIFGDDGKKIANCKYQNNYYDIQMAGSAKIGFADDNNEAVQGLKTTELFKAALGEAFAYNENAYPVLKAFANTPIGYITSAAIILADADNADQVASVFTATCPGEVLWSAPNMEFSANNHAIWTTADLTNRTPVTATIGNLRRHCYLQLTSATGVDLSDNEADVKAVEWYDLSGVRINAPAEGINIRITIYNNGTRRSEKVMIRNRISDNQAY